VVCEACKRQYHFCWSCGVEDWYLDFCSKKCLADSGHEVCPKCNGWSVECNVKLLDDLSEAEYEAQACKGYRRKV
jgi:hypothetical protein